MRGFDRDLIRGGHYGQRPLCAALTGRTHGCTDQPANVKKTLANSEPSTHGRLCCNPKLPGDDFLTVRRPDRRTPVCAASITLPGSPVSLSVGDEAPTSLHEG